MTLHIYSDTEHNTPNTREHDSREGSVSPRGMREITHGADAFCSPPTVEAARTLPAAGLSPSREPYRQAFPSDGPAGRMRWDGFCNLQAREDAVWSKSIRDLEQVPWCRMSENSVNAGGPLIGVSPQMRMWRWRWTSLVPSRGHITTTCTISTLTHTRTVALLSEWAAASAW